MEPLCSNIPWCGLLPVPIYAFTEGELEQSQGKGKFQRAGGNPSHAIPWPLQLSFYPLNLLTHVLVTYSPFLYSPHLIE